MTRSRFREAETRGRVVAVLAGALLLVSAVQAQDAKTSVGGEDETSKLAKQTQREKPKSKRRIN